MLGQLNVTYDMHSVSLYLNCDIFVFCFYFARFVPQEIYILMKCEITHILKLFKSVPCFSPNIPTYSGFSFERFPILASSEKL